MFKELKPYTVFLSDIEIFREKINNLCRNFSIKKYFKQKYWEIMKLEWYKNRLIFIYFFKKKLISKIIFKKIKKKINFDYNLIKLWKKNKFENLCTTQILFSNSFCRIPFEEREKLSKFAIQEKSGCICCITSNNFEFPIWWDQYDKISKFYQNIKIFQFSKFLNRQNCILRKLLIRNFYRNATKFLFLKLRFNFFKINFFKIENQSKFSFWTFEKKKILNNSLSKFFYWKINFTFLNKKTDGTVKPNFNKN